MVSSDLAEILFRDIMSAFSAHQQESLSVKKIIVKRLYPGQSTVTGIISIFAFAFVSFQLER